MEQFAKATNKTTTVAAKQKQANEKLAHSMMYQAGEPETAKNTGNPDSHRLNQYLFVKENPLPRVVSVKGDPISLLQDVNGIDPKIIEKE